MSLERNTALAVRYNEEVWNRRNWAAIAECCAPGYVVHAGDLSVVLTPDAHRARVEGWHAGFPDGRWELQDHLAQGDRVALRLVGRGTHTGPYWNPLLGTLFPTGRAVAIGEHTIYRVVDGRLAECWAQVDWLGCLRQLGVLPAPP